MIESATEKLLGLGAVIVIAVASVLLLLRLSRKGGGAPDGLLLGYPAHLYPARQLVRDGPLAALAATQKRLAGVHRQLPPQSDMAIWLGAFLGELRAIMDTAYRVTVITEVYGRPAPLERLIAELGQIESEVAEHVAQALLSREYDANSELLDGQLAALRLCVRELASLAGCVEAKDSSQIIIEGAA